jgi:hypothetical protein
VLTDRLLFTKLTDESTIFLIMPSTLEDLDVPPRLIVTATRHNGIQEEFVYNLDIRHIKELKIYCPRDWYKNEQDIDNITNNYAQVYSGDVQYKIRRPEFITNNDQTTSINPYKSEDHIPLIWDKETQNLTASLGTNIVTYPLRHQSLATLINSNTGKGVTEAICEHFILTVNQPSATFTNTSGKRLLIRGAEGHVLLCKPAFNSFKSLLDNKGPVIRRNLFITDAEDVHILSIDDSANTVELSQIKDDDINDGLSHALSIRLLTMKSILPDVKTTNNPRYFIEIAESDVDLYSFDRVFMNTAFYPQQPMKINGHYFNNENAPLYKNPKTVWKNDQGYTVYECDEKGRLIEWTVDNDALMSRVLGNAEGDISEALHGAVDRRHKPRQPNYITPFEYYFNEFYIEGQPMNPFWQFLSAKDVRPF